MGPHSFDFYVRELAIELSPAERHAHRVLVGLGKRFLIDYGYRNLIERSQLALRDAETPKRMM